MSGYHINKIAKGTLGGYSKIEEEFEELTDAVGQNNPIMILCECADIIGAIEEYVRQWNISLDDIIEMKKATAKAFKDGRR